MVIKNQPPKYDYRKSDDLLYKMLKLIPSELSGWRASIGADILKAVEISNDENDLGMVFLKAAARFQEIIVNELNRVPQKNFLTFLDFMGIDPLPPKYSRVPLTFTLSEGATKPVVIPKGTNVGVVETEGVEFETEVDLIASNIRVQRLLSIHPESDQWTHHIINENGTSNTELQIFHGDSRETRIEHTLWIGGTSLLNVNEDSLLELNIEADNDLSSWSDFLKSLRWEVSPNWDRHTPDIVIKDRSVKLSFNSIEKIEESEVKSIDNEGRVALHNSGWLRVRTTRKLPDVLPKILSIDYEVKSESDTFSADVAFFNTNTLDISKDFYPFGERPKFNDTFYLACETALMKQGVDVSIDIILTEGNTPVPGTTGVTLRWEYWDGDAWLLLGETNESGVSTKNPGLITKDGTKAFTTDKIIDVSADGRIEFNCPAMQKTTVHGEENYWLRCRMVKGDYGMDAHMEIKNDPPQTLEDYTYTLDSFAPPSIQTLRFSVSTIPDLPDIKLISTAGTFRDVTSNKSFELATYVRDTAPSFYIGLEGIDIKSTESIILYMHIDPIRFGERKKKVFGEEDSLQTVVGWQYWNGSKWLDISVFDDTLSFIRPGLLTFTIPDDFVERHLFGEKHFWLRAVLNKGVLTSPTLRGVYANTCWANQSATLTDEVLGSSNGEASQQFNLSKSPVLDGEVIEVREPVVPGHMDGVRIVNDEAGNVIEVWVKWVAVNNFNASTSRNRHYVIHHASGRIIFGDGINGMVPPVGHANIVAKSYKTGGGIIGNRKIGDVTVLKTTIPTVDGVINHVPSIGGMNQEDIDNVMERGPHTIKNRGRAVTLEDYEWIARQASPLVARVSALSNMRLGSSGKLIESQGWVTLVVLPDIDEPKPQPNSVLISDVKKWVSKRALLSIADRIDVVGAEYHDVTVTVTVVAKDDVEEKVLQANIKSAIHKLLHPLYGGHENMGWEFGKDVLQSEVINVIRDVQGVERLLDISISSLGDGGVPMPINGLLWSGSHIINIERR